MSGPQLVDDRIRSAGLISRRFRRSCTRGSEGAADRSEFEFPEHADRCGVAELGQFVGTETEPFTHLRMVDRGQRERVGRDGQLQTGSTVRAGRQRSSQESSKEIPMGAPQHSPHKPVQDTSLRAALDPQSAADYLSVSRQTIYRLIARGALRSFKIGRSTRIPVADLNALIGEGQ